MLVKLVDHKGKVRYINPMFVKSVEPKGDAQALIDVSGWATKFRVDMTPDAAAELLNAAMPVGVEAILGDLDTQRQQSEAAVNM